jgi:hypothetical protein
MRGLFSWPSPWFELALFALGIAGALLLGGLAWLAGSLL